MAGGLIDYVDFLNEPSGNRYRVAREVLSRELASVGGALFAQIIDKQQLERMQEVGDPGELKAMAMLELMIGGEGRAALSKMWQRYVAIGQILVELAELEGKEDERLKAAGAEE